MLCTRIHNKMRHFCIALRLECTHSLTRKNQIKIASSGDNDNCDAIEERNERRLKVVSWVATSLKPAFPF